MVDTSQILLIAAVTIMTVILTIIGIQLIFILKELRRLMTRAHSVLDHVEGFGTNITHGYSEIVGFVAGIKKVMIAMEKINSKPKKKNAKK